jgi:hypothetical protein
LTILTPNFADQQHAKSNGSSPLHVLPAHEPTKEGEQPKFTTFAETPNPVLKIVEMPAPNPLKVALIGTAPSSRMLAPYSDPSWEIWACSPGNMNALPRVNLWFELHSNLLWPEHESYGRPYIEWLKQQTFPIFMQDQSLVPNAVTFPRDEMVEMFGDDFFTSSFAWMMALAISKGATEIALYGIDMASRDEYIRQRPGFYYFRQMARQRGIKVSAPHESDIMQSPPLYAYVDSTPFGRKILARRQEVSGRVGGMTQQRDQLNNNINYLQGALEDLDYFESIWSGVSNDMSRVEYKKRQLETENAALKARIAELMSPKMVFEPMSMTIGTPPTETPPRRKRRIKAQPEVSIEAIPEPAIELPASTE